MGDICISLSRRSGESRYSISLADEKPGNHLLCAGTSSVVLEPVKVGSKSALTSSSSSSPMKAGDILLQSANQFDNTASAASSSRSNGNGSPPPPPLLDTETAPPPPPLDTGTAREGHRRQNNLETFMFQNGSRRKRRRVHRRRRSSAVNLLGSAVGHSLRSISSYCVCFSPHTSAMRVTARGINPGALCCVSVSVVLAEFSVICIQCSQLHWTCIFVYWR